MSTATTPAPGSTLNRDPQYRAATDADLAAWVQLGEVFHSEPEFITYLEREEPDLYAEIVSELENLAIQARYQEWRTPGVGGRAEQLLPGTPGSFSDRTDWATWLLVGGRGSGKSRTGAEAVREMLLGREWGHDPRTPPYFALVGKRLDSVRVDMVQNTLLPVLPPGAVVQWNRSTVELTLANGVYLRGFSSEAKENLRGPNLIGAWGDEVASWVDARMSPANPDSTMSILRNGLRNSDGGTWTPRLILTTTPKPVEVLRNPDPDDMNNPGPGIYDQAATVISNMSTLENIANLSPHFIESVVKPLEGTRMYDQEILGYLVDAAKGALWSHELVEGMRVTSVPVPLHHPGSAWGIPGIKRVVIGLDPSVGAGEGDEYGLVVVGQGFDGNAYILQDLSGRGPATEWAEKARKAFEHYSADAIVAETNNGGELVAEVLGVGQYNLPIVEVKAKRGKYLRAEPVAHLSDQGRLRIVGSHKRLEYQMMTWDPESGDDSPDRLDAMVYAVLHLLPPNNVQELLSVVRSRSRRRAR